MRLLTTEDINRELISASAPALGTSLSADSASIVDIPYADYIDYAAIGPRAKYGIRQVDEGEEKTRLCVMDVNGNVIGCDRAKIIISKKNGRPRLLFKDPSYNEWIEPESFYPFTSDVFYEQEKNIHIDDVMGFSIEAIKSPVWHGIPGIGIKIKIYSETLIFSSDTVNDSELWERLYTNKRDKKSNIMTKEFESSYVIYGDINDYIERIWSEERYVDAVNAFNGAVVIHDIAVRNSVVHTDYRRLRRSSLDKNTTILTHSPDRMTSEWVLSHAGKEYKVKGNSFFEITGDGPYRINADIYHKEDGKYYVGYKNEAGRYAVYKKDGILGLSSDGMPGDAKFLYRVNLYEDIKGKYFPKIEEDGIVYNERADGLVELIKYTDKGSNGKIVESCRENIPDIAI